MQWTLSHFQGLGLWVEGLGFHDSVAGHITPRGSIRNTIMDLGTPKTLLSMVFLVPDSIIAIQMEAAFHEGLYNFLQLNPIEQQWLQLDQLGKSDCMRPPQNMTHILTIGLEKNRGQS